MKLLEFPNTRSGWYTDKSAKEFDEGLEYSRSRIKIIKCELCDTEIKKEGIKKIVYSHSTPLGYIGFKNYEPFKVSDEHKFILFPRDYWEYYYCSEHCATIDKI